VGQLAKHTITFSLLTLLSRVTGLVRVSVFAAVLGSGRFDDAYQLANTIPNIIYEFILGGLLSAILIPLLVEAQQRHGKDSPEAWRVANLLIGYVGALLAVVSGLAILFSPQIVGLLTALGRGTHAEQSRELAIHFFRFFAPQMFFYGLNAVFMAILNSRGVFAITAAAPIVNNLVVIATVLLFRWGIIGVTGLAVGTTAGIAAMALVQVPWLTASGMPLRPRVSLSDPLLRSVVRLGIPVLAVGLANLVGTVVRSNFLYTVGSGFTTYTFCFQLIMMPYGIIAVSLATVLYPLLAEHAASNRKELFLESLMVGSRWTIFSLLPVVVLMSGLAEPIVRVVFERGQFSYANTRFTAQFLAIYALSILPYALVILASRAFYAQKDTATPMWINVAGVILNTACTVLLYRSLSILAIPVAAVVTYCTTTTLSYGVIKKRLAVPGAMKPLLSSWKIFVSAAIMAVATVMLARETTSLVTVLERGERFPAHISARYDAGGVLVLHNDKELREFWKLIAKDDTPPPGFDFRRSRVVAVFAPRGSTSATLTLANASVDSQAKTAELLVKVHKHSTPSATALEEPAYLLAQIAAPVETVMARFAISDQPPRKSFREFLQLEELVRLLGVSIVGVLVFFLSCLAMRVDEAHETIQKLAKILHR